MNNVELARRMLDCASDYQCDADILNQQIDSFGCGSTILGVISLEVMLKCVRLLDTGQRVLKQGGHDYARIWADISDPTQEAILKSAQERAPSALRDQSIEVFLREWQLVFEKDRYPFERLMDESEAAIAKRGAKWVEDGARLDEADIRYHPEELMCLTHGLRLWIETQTT